MLHKLPRELFNGVIDKLSTADLKSLCQTSKFVRASTVPVLWRSVTITPRSEYALGVMRVVGLPKICSELATELRFHSTFNHNTKGRCPHTDEDGQESSTSSDNEEYNQDSDPLPFDRLTQAAVSVLEKFSNDQLHSFSWELGTCISSTILGSRGTVPINQPSIKSLTLITDGTCSQYYDDECEIDLSPFCQLRSLSWKAPNADNLGTLFLAVRSNAAHLRELELDFVDWPTLRECQDIDSDDESEEQNYFTRDILGLNRRSPQPCFRDIRKLSLSQVPLGAAMAQAVNFDTLVSLCLRNCPAWDQFLERILTLNLPLRLKALEIQASDSVTRGIGSYVIRDFVDAFSGLEELFICEPGPESSLELWKHVHSHQDTLKRMIHHQRTIDTDDDSPYFEQEFDLNDLAIIGREMSQMKENPLQNPLSQLDLEVIGLSCLPERLKYILVPFKLKNSLKLVHIRQSRVDLGRRPSWATKERRLPGRPIATLAGDELEQEGTGMQELESYPMEGLVADSDPPSETEDNLRRSDMEELEMEQQEALDSLRPEFRQFAEWIFGPDGVASLQVIAYGDFSYGGSSYQNIVLRRNTAGQMKFRCLNQYRREWHEALHEYYKTLRACPMEPLLTRF